MTTFDDIKDWTYGTVKEVKVGEKKIVLETGEGALFSTPVNGYYIEVWPAGKLPLLKPSIGETEQVEAFRIESGGLTGDTFTWTSRKQLGTPERSIQVGDQVCAPLSAEVITAMQTAINERPKASEIKLSELKTSFHKHSELEALTTTDDHSQYIYTKAGEGRAGGQKIVGGTESENNLELTSTSNATKGKITLGANSAYLEKFNETTGKGRALGIGTASPTATLHLNNAAFAIKTEGTGENAQPFTAFEGGVGQKVEGSSAGTNKGGTGSSLSFSSGFGGKAVNTGAGNATGGDSGFLTIIGQAGAFAEAGNSSVVQAGSAGNFSIQSGTGGVGKGLEGTKPKEVKGGESAQLIIRQGNGGEAIGGETCLGGLTRNFEFRGGIGGTANGEAGFTKTATAAAASTMMFFGNKGGKTEGGCEKATGGAGGTLAFEAGPGGATEGGTVSNTQAKGGSITFVAGAAGETAATGRVLSTGGEVSFAAGEGKNGSPGGPIKFKTYKENSTVGAEAEITAAGVFEVIKGSAKFKEGATVEGAFKAEGTAVVKETLKVAGTLTAEAAAVVTKTLKVGEKLTVETGGLEVVKGLTEVKEGLTVVGTLTLPNESIVEANYKKESVAKEKLAKAVQEELLKVGKPSAGAAYTSAKEETETKPTYITLILKCPAEAKQFTCALENGGVAMTFVFNGTTTGITKFPVTFLVEKGGKWKATMTNVTSTEIFRQIVNSV